MDIVGSTFAVHGGALAIEREDKPIIPDTTIAILFCQADEERDKKLSDMFVVCILIVSVSEEGPKDNLTCARFVLEAGIKREEGTAGAWVLIPECLFVAFQWLPFAEDKEEEAILAISVPIVEFVIVECKEITTRDALADVELTIEWKDKIQFDIWLAEFSVKWKEKRDVLFACVAVRNPTCPAMAKRPEPIGTVKAFFPFCIFFRCIGEKRKNPKPVDAGTVMQSEDRPDQGRCGVAIQTIALGGMDIDGPKKEKDAVAIPVATKIPDNRPERRKGLLAGGEQWDCEFRVLRVPKEGKKNLVSAALFLLPFVPKWNKDCIVQLTIPLLFRPRKK